MTSSTRKFLEARLLAAAGHIHAADIAVGQVAPLSGVLASNDPAELVKLAGLKNAQGPGITQVVPDPYMPNLPVIREYQQR